MHSQKKPKCRKKKQAAYEVIQNIDGTLIQTAEMTKMK